MSIRVFSGLLILLGAFTFIGCKQQTPQPMAQQIDFRKPLPDGMVALRKIDPSEYPDFGRRRSIRFACGRRSTTA